MQVYKTIRITNFFTKPFQVVLLNFLKNIKWNTLAFVELCNKEWIHASISSFVNTTRASYYKCMSLVTKEWYLQWEITYHILPFDLKTTSNIWSCAIRCIMNIMHRNLSPQWDIGDNPRENLGNLSINFHAIHYWFYYLKN